MPLKKNVLFWLSFVVFERNLFIFILCTCLPARLSGHHMQPGAYSGQERGLDPLEQELQVAVRVTMEQEQQTLLLTEPAPQLPSSLQCHLKGRRLETGILGNDPLSLHHVVAQLH